MVEVVLIERDAQTFVAIARSCALDELAVAFSECIAVVHEAITAQGLRAVLPPLCRFLSWDSKANRVEVQVGMRVEEADAVALPLVRGVLPRATWAVAWHSGSYETLPVTHAGIAEFVQRHDQVRRAGPPVAFYWADSSADPDPSSFRTEVCFPVLQISDSLPAD